LMFVSKRAYAFSVPFPFKKFISMIFKGFDIFRVPYIPAKED